MDHQYVHPYNNKLGYDCWLYTWHFVHKYWGKGRYIFGLNMLDFGDIQN